MAVNKQPPYHMHWTLQITQAMQFHNHRLSEKTVVSDEPYNSGPVETSLEAARDTSPD